MSEPKKIFGAESSITAVLHMDETTLHIHIMIVPIVIGICRGKYDTRLCWSKEKHNSLILKGFTEVLINSLIMSSLLKEKRVIQPDAIKRRY